MSFVDQGTDERAEVVQGAADVLVHWAKLNGAAVTVDPATAYVTLMDCTGSVQVARQLATIAANGKLSTPSTVFTTAAWQLQEDAIALFEWQVGAVPYADRLYFDVVLNKLYCPIDTSHLLTLYPDLENHLTAIGETDTTKFIKRAWSKFLRRIRSGHNRPSLILDKVVLVEPVLELSLYLVCRALSRSPDDLWDHRMKAHQEDYKNAVATLGEVKYDRNEDGLAEQNEVKRINRRKFTV